MAKFSVFLVIVLVALNACSRQEKKENVVSHSTSKKTDSTQIDLRAIEIAEVVLNLPDVMRFSKLSLMEKYGKLSVFFVNDSLQFSKSIIRQKGRPLEILPSRDMAGRPCYVFKEINIRNKTAEVLMYFDITGLMASGMLEYINGKWVPATDFRVGVR
jgi:hypothetical protein